MVVKEIKPNVYFVGVEDWDRRLFDELIPLPDETSYNAYLIKGYPKKEDLKMLENLADEIFKKHKEQKIV